jgi:hypothetical protein
MPFNEGMPQDSAHPWSYFPSERPDSMIDAFLDTIVPFAQDLKKGGEGCLFNSAYGDIYDILVPRPPRGPIPLEKLADYKVAILLGKHNIDAPLAERLRQYVCQGGTLILNVEQVTKHLSSDFLGLDLLDKSLPVRGCVHNLLGGKTGLLTEPYDYRCIELTQAKRMWIDDKDGILASVNQYGRGRVVLTTVDYMIPRSGARIAGLTKRMPLVELLMRQVVHEVLPLEVCGDVEYGLCKVADGWWVYLINNNGVTKFTRTPETLDVAKTVKCIVNMRGLAAIEIRELLSGKKLVAEQGKNSFAIDVGSGDVRVMKIVLGRSS